MFKSTAVSLYDCIRRHSSVHSVPARRSKRGCLYRQGPLFPPGFDGQPDMWNYAVSGQHKKTIVRFVSNDGVESNMP
jgi:hypothetical protein